MTQWLTDNLLTIITTLFGGTSFLGYVLERKKRRIQEKQETIDALKSMQDAYDRFTADALKKYDEVVKELEKVKKELEQVKQELITEKKKNRTHNH